MGRVITLLSRAGCLLLAVCATLSVGCGFTDSRERNAVITVGEQILPPEGLKVEIRRLLAEMETDRRVLAQIIDPLVEAIVERMSVLEYAREKNITVSEDELTSAAEDIRKDYTESEFREILLRMCLDHHEWLEGVRRQLLVRKVMLEVTQGVSAVASQDIKAYYDLNEEDFNRPAMVKFRQIVTETEEDAKTVWARLEQGAKMTELAEAYSLVPSFEDEDQLGWIATGDLEEAMEEAIFPLAVGKISPITKTGHGYHIFQMVTRRPGGKLTLAEAAEEIESKLLHEKRQSLYGEWLKGLKNRYAVKVDWELIKKLELG